eukprot:1992823-Prymnesium_polylepis.1
MPMRAVVPMLLLAQSPAPALAGDPSRGWLSYAIFEANATDIITSLSATMSVPDKPLHGGAEPAFWFGVQTHDGDGALVQAAQAYPGEVALRPLGDVPRDFRLDDDE